MRLLLTDIPLTQTERGFTDMFKETSFKVFSIMLRIYSILLLGSILILAARIGTRYFSCTQETNGTIAGYIQTEYERTTGTPGTCPVVSYRIGDKDLEYRSVFSCSWGTPKIGTSTKIKYDPGDPGNAFISIDFVSAAATLGIRFLILIFVSVFAAVFSRSSEHEKIRRLGAR